MIVYTLPALIPILLATGAYFLFGLFLTDINAFGVAAIIGAAVSALMEFVGLRGTLFFIPVGAWLGFAAVAEAVDSFTVWQFKGEPGTPFVWTKDADEILDSVQRFANRTLLVHGDI